MFSINPKNPLKSYQTILSFGFFLSGASALIYQIIWVREFGLVFGIHTFAVSTVLTTFMAGLALGNWLFGRRADAIRNPLRLFFFLELCIGLFALFFPILFQGLIHGYAFLNRTIPVNQTTLQLLRFALSFLFLLIPTTLMGGTLPAVSKCLIQDMSTLGRSLSRLYAINNLGAFIGCFFAGFIFIQTFGLQVSLLMGAMTNLICAGLILLAGRIRPVGETSETEPDLPEQRGEPEPISDRLIRFLLWCFALEGFTTLVYEVTWTRILLGFSFDKSVTFYTTVILSFVFGLFLGSAIVSRFLDNVKKRLLLFALCEIAIGLSAILILPVFANLADWMPHIRSGFGESWWLSLGKEYGIYFFIMLIPATLTGMTFPIAGKIAIPNLKKIGSRIGVLGSLDTIGSIAGSFAAGFILIPILGVVKATLLTAALNILIGGLLIFLNPGLRQRNKWFIAGVSLILSVAAWIRVPSNEYFRTWQNHQPGDRLLYYDEGVGASVAIPQNVSGIKKLAINGSVTAFANYGDIRVHKMLAYVPYLLCDEPRDALVIGLGMGVTVQSLVHPAMNSVDCVEIIPGVVEAARTEFSEINGNVLSHSKVRLIEDDGRSYLLSTQKDYDLITSNAVHARLSGNLYTKAFYEICRSRLRAKGVMCQWLSTNWQTHAEYKSLIRAFLEVFPDCAIWCVNPDHVLLVGSVHLPSFSISKLKGQFEHPKFRKDLAAYDLADPAVFLSHFINKQEILQKYVEGAEINTDENPLAEMSRVVSKIRIPGVLGAMIQMKTLAPIDTSGESGFQSKLTRITIAEKTYLSAMKHREDEAPVGMVIDSLNKALTLNPEEYRFRSELAGIYFYQKRFGDASVLLEQIVKIHPKAALEYERLGMAYIEISRLSDAEQAFKRSLKLAPGNPMPKFYLASIYASRGEFEPAEKLLKIIIRDFPEAPMFHRNLGVLYTVQRRFQAAEQALLRSLELDPSNQQTRQWLAQIQASKG